MLGQVSPMALNRPNTKDSPGIVRSGNTPAARSSAEMTGPLAPPSSVRSRSKNAAAVIVPTLGRSHAQRPEN